MSGANEARAAAGLRFKPYPAYKDSGVEWLGEIPAHWEVRRLKTIASVQLSNVDKKSVEGQESVRLCNYVDVYYNDRITPDWTSWLLRRRRSRCGAFHSVPATCSSRRTPSPDGHCCPGSSHLGPPRRSVRLPPRPRTAGARLRWGLRRSRVRRHRASGSISDRGERHHAIRSWRGCHPKWPVRHLASPRAMRHRSIARPGDGEDRCAGGEEGAAHRAAPGDAHRPHHPRRHQGPPFDWFDRLTARRLRAGNPGRPHEGLRRRVVGGDSGASGGEDTQACLRQPRQPTHTVTLTS